MCKTIMIIEGEQNFHTLYETILEDTGYRIIHACDEDEALSKLEEEKPNLIILDMILDMMNGDTFFLYLKGMPEYKDIPVIIVSNRPKREYENLRNMDPNLMFLDKTVVTKERLAEKIKTRIG